MTVLEIREIPRKASVVGFYLSTVTGLTILLKQDPTTVVFGKTSQIFGIDIFCASEFIDNSLSFCPLFSTLLVYRDNEGEEGSPV